MLIKITIENFKSFDKPTELTMVSSNKIRSIPKHRIKIKNTQLLKHAVLYGSNASGKTNLIDFFWFFKSCVENGFPVGSVNMYCRNKEENINRKSSFEIQFSVGDTFYAYGFSAILSQHKITDEWLYELYQNGTAKRIFEREGSKQPTLDKTIRLPESDARDFQRYAEDFSGNTTSLFLSEMNYHKHLAEDSKLFVFKNVYDWVCRNLIILPAKVPSVSFSYYYDAASLPLAKKLLQSFDIGLPDVYTEETTSEELRSKLAPPLFEALIENLNKTIQRADSSISHMAMRTKDSIFNVELCSNHEPLVTALRLYPENSFSDFSLEDESEGAKRLFNLLDILVAAADDLVFIVDDLDRSLHPKLTQHLLELFAQLHIGKRNQLIFTTHEPTIMDQSLFRRDEIWFVERDAEGCSNIYPLDRFKERYDKVLSKAYLDGRYGAIPHFTLLPNMDS